MLAKNDCLQILKSFNINSTKYEPTIYENNKEIGICLDIKDSLFGYLTRIFTFNNKEDLSQFLTSFFWYKNNHQKYDIKLSLKEYNTKKTTIIYKYKNQILSLDNMLNIDNFLNEQIKEKEKLSEKEYLIKSIEELTNYLINFQQMKENIKEEKNKLKTEENDLKFALLNELTIYYGKKRTLNKKDINLEQLTPTNSIILQENVKNIKSKSISEIEEYLKLLIEIIKNEELDEKNLVNIYSNSVYKYNIDILKKQIEFVKSKINAEKNFNLKGSKLHNIDEELKSFLKTNLAPTKIEVFLNDNKTQIENKFKQITNIKDACKIITGKDIKITKQDEQKNNDSKNNLKEEFKKLEPTKQANLVLYNSLYKSICNYIIENNYPSLEIIKKAFDFDHYFNELEEIIFDENNNHYLNNYFKNINFNNLDGYINSIINICKDVENTFFKLKNSITLFGSDEKNKYKLLTTTPTKNSKYLITTQNDLLYIPYKLTIDWDTHEINIIEDDNYYTKDEIIEEIESITVNKYKKQNIEKDDIIITTDLILTEELIFNRSHLEGEIYE